MKKLLLSIVALALAATAYVAAPFATAWSIREAVRTGNSAYLEAKIEWDTVRESLRRSLTVAALGPPETGAAAPEKPGLWQRIKARVGRSAVDNLVESYVTPEGLPQLFTYRKLYREPRHGRRPRPDAALAQALRGVLVARQARRVPDADRVQDRDGRPP